MYVALISLKTCSNGLQIFIEIYEIILKIYIRFLLGNTIKCVCVYAIMNFLAVLLLVIITFFLIGEEIVCYESPRPMVGIHRIIFVLFRQLGRQMIHSPGWRQNFNTRDFAEVYNLGLPVAAMYFNCKRGLSRNERRR